MQATLNDARPTYVDGAVFRRVMGHWATGVAVVTVRADGEPHGITVNSFTSVSLDPPLVLICIDGRARTHDLLRACGRFCVNVLHAGQGHLCARFSGRHADGHGEFADCSHSSAAGGAPVLDACLAYLDCRVVGTLPHGDHTIFIGLVEDARVGGDKDPLIFFRGRFGTHEAI